MIKVIAMMKRKEGVSPDEFARYWYEEHAPLGFEVLPDSIKVVKYVQNYAIRMEEDWEPLFDGVAEFGFEDIESFQKWMDWYFSDGGQVLRDDEDKFIDKDSIRVVAVEEKVIRP